MLVMLTSTVQPLNPEVAAAATPAQGASPRIRPHPPWNFARLGAVAQHTHKQEADCNHAAIMF